MDFKNFKQAVAKRFAVMSKGQLYRVNATKDELWSTYLASFPEGSNPIYKERTEHDCNCCKSFIANLGNVVSISNNKIISIWDIAIPNEPEYQTVATALSNLIHSKQINNIFLTEFNAVGSDKSFFDEGNRVVSWEHFYAKVPAKFVKRSSDIPTLLNEPRTLAQVFQRSLETITQDSIETVLDLISQNSLYRGNEHKFAVESFGNIQKKFNKLSSEEKQIFIWEQSGQIPASVSKIRNTAIGTLLIDLSEGKDIESAVKAFESVVAPANYKRPTALVSKKMVDDAKKKIEELGLTSALNRRFANISDITVNNLLFVDRSTKAKIENSVFDEIAVATKPKKLSKVEDISIEKFISDVVPRAESIELMVENKHSGNLVSLIAPQDPTAEPLFKWGNAFSWSYNGNMADSIKERVKSAGGNVTGELCCRLSWDYSDDLDFHMIEPGYEISFSNRRHKSPNGGELDIDANGADGVKQEPCENIFYERTSKMKPGTYTLYVHNWSRRSDGVGFDVEIDLNGVVTSFHYDKVIKNGAKINIADILVTKEGVSVKPLLSSTTASRKIWNIDTMQFSKVTMITTSPNYWDEKGVGNKHYFFVLENCQNDGTARGFFNEFLREDLNQHRKVMEIVGGKSKVIGEDNQLSGVGFSDTQRNSVQVLVKSRGNVSRALNVTF